MKINKKLLREAIKEHIAPAHIFGAPSETDKKEINKLCESIWTNLKILKNPLPCNGSLEETMEELNDDKRM